MRSFLYIFSIVMTTIMINLNDNQAENYVPDEKTAVKVAEAIWVPIYGDRVLDKKPFKATLSEDGKIWIVKGTVPKGMLGGYPIIEIRKSDCKIIKVSHSK